MPEENTNRIVKLETMSEEVMRRLEKLDGKIDNLTKEIAISNKNMEDLVIQRDTQFKKEFITKEEAISLDKRISSIEGFFTWAMRIILTSIIGGLLYLLGFQQ